MMSHDKKKQLIAAIEDADRVRTREIVYEHKMNGTTLTEQQYCRFIKLAVEWHDLSLAYMIHGVRPKLDVTVVSQLLWSVIENSDTTIATMLVKAGADVNKRNTNHPFLPSFLHVLAMSNDAKKNELALLMMEHGADVIAEDKYGDPVLEYALMSGNLALAQKLFPTDVLSDIHILYAAACSPKPIESMLLIINDSQAKTAITQTETISEVFKMLCELDIDKGRMVDMAKVLIDIEIPEPSAILDAVFLNNMELVKVLLGRTDVDNATKMILLHCAVSLTESSMAQMLIEWGADIEYSVDLEIEEFNRGMRPLHAACQYESQENIQLLLQLGAKVNVTDDFGNTPFSFLVPDLFDESCRLFIKHFALLTSKGDTLNQQDLAIIASHPTLQQFYDVCLYELQRMMERKFFNRISFHSIFTKNLKQLSMLMRHQNFLKEYRNNIFSFFVYRDDLNRRFRAAGKRNDLLMPIVDALYETLDKILPHVPIEIIIQYLYDSDTKMSVGESILLDSRDF